MTSYSVQFFKLEHLALYRIATKIIDGLPQVLPIEKIRCHEIARVVGKLLDLEVVDGKFARLVSHSWIILEQQLVQSILLDPYAVGRIPPVQLVLDDCALGQYIKKEPRIDIDLVLVDQLVASMRFQTSQWMKAEQLHLQKRAL